MSCLPDTTLALYVDGALTREASRSVELHLIQCRRCRALVLALREQADLRADVRRDRPAPAADGAGRPVPPHGRSRALALALTLVGLAAAAAGTAAFLESVESGLPEALGRLGPVPRRPWTWRGAYAMAIDLVFVLRDSAPAVFDLALPVAAMASASALLSYALSALRRRIGGPGARALAALAILAAPAPARAHFGLHEHEDVTIAAGTVHDGTLLASARSVTVDGVVDGDLVVLTERLVLRGEVRGNLFAVARELDLRGLVDGTLIVGGERSSLSGEVRGDLYAAGDAFALEPGGRLGRDATLVAERVVLEGSLGRDANALFSESIEARGSVGRHLRARAGRLVLKDGARIGGDVLATLPDGAEVERSAGAQVAGDVRVERDRPLRGAGLERFREPELYAWMLLHVGSGFVLGMLLHLLAPGILAARAEGPRDLLRALGIGLATLVAAPIALLAAAATIVGIPVALIAAAGLLAALYIGWVGVAALVGAALVRPSAGGHGGFGAALAAGLAILVLLTHLPFLGGAVSGVAVVTGLGLLAERAFRAWRARGVAVPP